ncbi:MAG: type II toxin-antitoxin system RelE/ParE family toxin [Ruminococcus sp.]|jgi:mRNA interferase RelE/StbE|nr:type II toxin-antitoxin system RelE/ParE family toxin [Ruminococcus sp.]
MKWNIRFYSKTKKELKALDKSVSSQIMHKISQVLENPLPFTEGGYGEPLGNKAGISLAGFNKIKHRGLGMRTVYKLYREDDEMYVIVISARDDMQVYKIAESRLSDAEKERRQSADIT